MEGIARRRCYHVNNRERPVVQSRYIPRLHVTLQRVASISFVKGYRSLTSPLKIVSKPDKCNMHDV